MWLRSSICNLRFSVRKNRRHYSIFGCGNRCLIKKYVRTDQLVCSKLKFTVGVYTGPQLSQGKKV